MKIHALTTCVSYAPLFARSLDRWLAGLATLTVVTTPGDRATHSLCVGRTGVRLHVTDAFFRGGPFCKATAMNEALSLVPWHDWILFFDADCVPPEDWFAHVAGAGPEMGNLYGARRRQSGGDVIPDRELAGYYQMFHATDAAAMRRPLLDEFTNASGYDSLFMMRWPHSQRIFLPLMLEHIGEPGRNWCGMGNDKGMQQLWDERRKRKGWMHERIDHAKPPEIRT